MKKEILLKLLSFMVKRKVIKMDELGDFIFPGGTNAKITWEMLQYDKWNAIEKELDKL